MVLGIISLALFCVWYVSIPVAIVGLILGVIASGKVKRGEGGGAGMAKAGIICTIIALALAILIAILAIVGITMFGKQIRQIQQQQLQQMHQQQNSAPTPDSRP
jgi:Na+/H+-dicarboxylate symporter